MTPLASLNFQADRKYAMRIAEARLCFWVFVLAGLTLASGANAETLELKSGDTLENVVIIERSEHRVVIEHPVLGRLEIPAIEVKPEEAETVKPGIFGTNFMRGWDRSAGAGLSGSSGVTREFNLNAELNASFESDDHRAVFASRYFLSASRQNGKYGNTNNDVTTSYLHDFLISDSKWFFFGNGSHRYDQVQSWTHRVQVAGGVGYDFLRNDDWTVSARIGPGYTRKSEGENKDEANGVAAFNATWRISDGNSISFITSYFSMLNDVPEFRSLSRLEWKIATGIIEGLGVKLGGSYEYNSSNAGDNNDRRYYGTLVYDF
jgi:putative salt-induced outer membrane protein YdiY